MRRRGSTFFAVRRIAHRARRVQARQRAPAAAHQRAASITHRRIHGVLNVNLGTEDASVAVVVVLTLGPEIQSLHLRIGDLAGTYPEGWKGLRAPEDPGTLTGTLDGLPLSNRPVHLAVGTHQITTDSACQPAECVFRSRVIGIPAPGLPVVVSRMCVVMWLIFPAAC